MPKKIHKYCCVLGCVNHNTRCPDYSFFEIPKNPIRRLQWLEIISREDLLNKNTSGALGYVCEMHFVQSDVVNHKRKRLARDTVPRLYLPVTIVHDKQTQTLMEDYLNVTDDANETENDAPESKKKRKQDELSGFEELKDNAEKDINVQKELFNQLCPQFLSKNLAILIKARNYFKSKRKSIDYKMFCLNLYQINPQAYGLFQKTIHLPDKDTLSKFYIPITTQVSDSLMGTLKIKVDKMSADEQECTVVVGTMSLKTNLFYDIKRDKIIGFHEVDGVQSPKPAKYVIVVLVQGIFVKWYQAVGYALISECKNDDDVSKWIDKLISKLFDIGLKIRALVSDLEPELLAKEQISTSKTHFTIDGHKIYYIFDIPTLIKSVRDNLMAYDFHFQESAAKFEHIIKFYECDQNTTFKKAYKLTRSHINPTCDEKTKVHFATQLLSRSVASGISIYADLKMLDESALHTAKLINLMNDLFDILNSSKLNHNHKNKRAFRGNKSQVFFLNDALLFFQTLKLVDPKNGNDEKKNVQFIQGFQTTIMSVLKLHQDLKQEGHKYLLTRRLNKDTIDSFFEKIRSKNGKSKLTSREFVTAFRKDYFDLNESRKGKSDDLTDFSKFIEEYRSRVNLVKNVNPVDDEKDVFDEIVRLDYTKFYIPKNNALYYICGALLKKCMDHHDCEVLKKYISTCQNEDNKNPIIPPEDFVENVKKLDQVFSKTFQKQYLNSRIGLSIYKEMIEIEICLPCTCFPKEYLLKLYIRMRIYLTLKFNNKSFETCF